MPRTATIARDTKETKIKLSLDLDGSGKGSPATGVGFFDHMLELFTRHSLCDLGVEAVGDLHVDAHHTVEDVGIVLGQAIAQAVGDKAGLVRYGHSVLPMDETLVTVALDLSGRSYLVFDVDFPGPSIGEGFETELVREFFTAVAANAKMNLHIRLEHGSNNHHIAEAIFKAFARALRMAIATDPRQIGVPSSKGSL